MSRPLPHAVQRQLVSRAQNGDQAARQLLTTSNQPFVQATARAFLGRGVELEDLVQEGSIGLLRAVDKFDLSQPVNFMTYAAYWVRQAMGRACEQQGTSNRYGFRVPAHVAHAMSRIARQRPILEEQMGRALDEQELADALELSLDCVQMALRTMASGRVANPETEEGDELLSLVADERPSAQEELEEAQLNGAVSDALSRLPERQRAVLAARLGLDGAEPAAERELSQRWSTTRAQLQSLRASALTALGKDLELARELGRDPLSVAQACGHLRSDAPSRLPEPVGRLGHGLAGRYGSFWWLLARTRIDEAYQVLVSDGPEGPLVPLRQALAVFAGEQRMEVVEFAASLPLAPAQRCRCCAS